MKHLQELLIRLGLRAIGVLALSVLTVGAVQAMPSFTRQTGMSCNQCHFTHDPTPSFTIQAMKFRANGYRFAERRTKLQAGQPGAAGGETLDIPWDDYMSYRFESVVANKSQAPGGASTELASNPTTRLAWFITGPVTKNIGFWNEFYSSATTALTIAARRLRVPGAVPGRRDWLLGMNMIWSGPSIPMRIHEWRYL